jgi:hypothetical protein
MLSIAAYSTELQASLNVGGYKVKMINPLQITNNDKLTNEQKKKAQQQALQGMMADIANLVIADKTGANINTVAQGNVEALASSAAFDKKINSIAPTNQTGSYSVVAPTNGNVYNSSISYVPSYSNIANQNEMQALKTKVKTLEMQILQDENKAFKMK